MADEISSTANVAKNAPGAALRVARAIGKLGGKGGKYRFDTKRRNALGGKTG